MERADDTGEERSSPEHLERTAAILAALTARTADVGLAIRGVFHPDATEFTALAHIGTVVLLGFTGSVQWARFAASVEATDGAPNPLDRWSRRLIDALAQEFEAMAFYPSGATALPFQRLARHAEPVHQSPLGLLIHPQWGLWHAYRGGLQLRERLPLATTTVVEPACSRCRDRPCLSGCPVGAVARGTLEVERCVAHVRSDAGVECRERGCLARRACPEGTAYRYVADQARFHMAAFLRAVS